MLEHITEEREKNKKKGRKQTEKIELVSVSRGRDVTANNLMGLNSTETMEQFCAAAELQRAWLLGGDCFH